MRKMYRISSLFLVLVVIIICVSGAASPVHAIGLDPVSFLYPIWQAYGMANGVTITTIGGDQFNQQGFDGLFEEWQQSEVAQGVQSAVQTLSDFVNTVSGAVSVVPGQASVSGLLTKVRLGSQLVGKLARFWNWIIVDKLGGTSVDSVDFTSTTGNLITFNPGLLPIGTLNDDPGVIGADLLYYPGAYPGPAYLRGFASVPAVVVYRPNSTSQFNRYFVFSKMSGGFWKWVITDTYYRVATQYLTDYDQDTGLYYYWNDFDGSGLTRVSGSVAYFANTFAEAKAIAVEVLGGDNISGSITVAPDVGVDTLGFPDTSQPDYVPADTNIGWNIPYDEGADTNDYLDDAYQKSLDNDLQLDDQISDSPVTGSGEVGSVGEYVTPGLAEVFPFCIPFDIYRFFTLLVAEPVAPSWTAQLVFPDELGGAQSVTIDLNTETWNNLASIVRMMELFAFIIGLAYVTRSMFIRG